MPRLARDNGGATPGRELCAKFTLDQAITLFLQRDATPTLFLVVRGLPKGALIEKQVLYHTGRGVSVDDDGDEGDTATPVSCPASYSTGAAWFPIKSRVLSESDTPQKHSPKATLKCDPKYRISNTPQHPPW
jgi:hypothetical protein